MKPILKYRGGKSKEISFFERYMPLNNEYNRYFEPFFGGGALFFHLQPQRAVINDINERLINFYREIQMDFDAVSTELLNLQQIYEENQRDYKELKAEHPDERVENRNEALYYRLRDMFNNIIEPEFLDSVLYFFINKTSYSGMIRYNSRGEYNVPFGRYANFNTRLLTREHSFLLQNAEIFNTDYVEIFNMANADDFMFLDPPYDCTFNDYGNLDLENGFNEDEHRRLAAHFRNLNCRALMVIGSTPLIRDLYGDMVIGQYEKSYAVNIRNRFKSASQHLIITNY